MDVSDISRGAAPSASERVWLHDRTLQSLEFIAAGGYRDDVDADMLRRVAALAADELRGFIEDRRPREQADLVAALADAVAEARVRAGATRIELLPAALDVSLPPDHVAVLAAAVGEALANVVKHAHATCATVRCEAGQGRVRIAICDDGDGFDTRSVRARTGLRDSICGRVGAIGGSVAVDSRPGGGTRVELNVAAGAGERRQLLALERAAA